MKSTGRALVLAALVSLSTTMVASVALGATSSAPGHTADATGRLTADFNGDGFADLAVGAPAENIGSISNAGSVNVIYGSATGLAATGNQLWYEGAGGILRTAQADDLYGFSAAAGDFNEDGFSDLAVGIPGKTVGSATSAGAVNVIYGSAAGLTSTGNQVWSQGDNGILDTAEQDDGFGNSLATGDLNGDGFADLVVAAAGEELDTNSGAGALNVIYGSASGLASSGNQFWSEDTFSPFSAESDDFFGAVVSAGDFNGDGFGDVASGIPFRDGAVTTDSGQVRVIYGSMAGLTSAGSQVWDQDTPNIAGASGNGDVFGFSLASGDLNGDTFADLAVGIPGESIAGHPAAGAAAVIYGSASGLATLGNQRWHQNTSGIPGAAESGDQFGFSVAIGDLNGDGNGDLAVGVDLENIGRISNAGLVDVIYGSASRLTSTGSQQWYQGASGIVGSAEKGDFFGFTLVIEDFGKGAPEDLAVSAPGENLGTKVDAGVAQVIYGGSTGLSSAGNQLWDQDSAGILGGAEAGDNFGFGLADGETLAPVHR